MKVDSLVVLILTFVVCIFATPFITIRSIPQIPCSYPPGQPQGASVAWPQNATVNVGIDPALSQSIIADQLNKWRTAGALNVTFSIKAPSELGPGTAGGGNPILFFYGRHHQVRWLKVKHRGSGIWDDEEIQRSRLILASPTQPLSDTSFHTNLAIRLA